jgi:16S rRNA (guanine966-N2)-methyltransferase
VRIIGGVFRGRRIGFPDAQGLRPTADRVRETLFNWLAPVIEGARCLDLFAGSAALGIEALSRGAAQVSFVERSGVVARQIRDNLALLEVGERAHVFQAEALKFLRGQPPVAYGVVFLDPPFATGLLADACSRLERGGWLAHDAFVYLEQDAHRPWPQLPDNWETWREGQAGQAAFRLMRRNSRRG